MAEQAPAVQARYFDSPAEFALYAALQQALQAVQNEPGLTAYEIAGRMHWRIRSRNWAEFPLVQKYFAVGETLAHLDYLEIRGQVCHRMENEKHRYYPV